MTYDNILADPNEDQTVEDAIPTPLPPVEPYEHLAGVAPDLNTHTLDPAAAKALSEAILTHEATTGTPSPIRDLHTALTSVRGSTFSDVRTASGRNAAMEAGIALPSGGRMGDQYEITTPDGRKFIAPLIDRGPAAWTGRGVDVSGPLAKQMGYTKDFPTDSQFGVRPVGNAGPAAFIMHHTSGRGDVNGVVQTLRERGLGVQYVMDRDGKIEQIGGPGASHMKAGWGLMGRGLSNKNTVGMEVIAKNDQDVTPAQIESAKQFIANNYPDTPVYGHGEVNPGHKEADEGMSIVNTIRAERAGADMPMSSVRPYGPAPYRPFPGGGDLPIPPRPAPRQAVPADTITEEELRKLYPPGTQLPPLNEPETPAETSPSESNLLDLLLAQAAPKTPQAPTATTPTNQYLAEQPQAPQPPAEDDLQAELEAMLQPTVAAPAPTSMTSGWPAPAEITPEEARSIPAYMRPQNKFATQQVEQGQNLSQSMEPVRQIAQSAAGMIPETALGVASLAGGAVHALPAAASYLGAGPAFDAAAEATKPLMTGPMGASHAIDEGIREFTGASSEPHGWARAARIGSAFAMPGSLPMRMLSTGFSGASDFLAPSAHADPFAATEQVNTVGGPTRVSWDEMKGLGIMGIVSMGAIVAPSIFGKFKNNVLPTLTFGKYNPSAAPWGRPVREAAPGTVDITTPGDRARAVFDDADRGLVRMMERSKLPTPAMIEDLTETFKSQSRATAKAIVTNAITNGRAETPSFRFQVRRSLNSLNQQYGADKVVTDYLHALNIKEQIYAKWAKARKKTATAGSPTVHGYDFNSVTQTIRNFETARPELVQIADLYRENVKEMRAFQANVGTHAEYATLSSKAHRDLGRQHPNYIPTKYNAGTQNTVAGVQPAALVNPFVALSNHLQHNMVKRMQNEPLMLMIDLARRHSLYGANMFKRVAEGPSTAKVPKGLPRLSENAAWRKNTVSGWRRGKKETYTTSPLVADLAKMDPFFFTSFEMLLSAPKRAFEGATTGKFAPQFAITSGMRNFTLARLASPKGRKPVTHLGQLYAVPQALGAQLARSISDSIDKGNNGWLNHVMGDAAVNALGMRMGHAYTNSMLALLNAHGGQNTSYMERQTYRATTGLAPAGGGLSRLTQAWQSSSGTAKALLGGIVNMERAFHNSASLGYFSRNVNRAVKTGTDTQEEVSRLANESMRLTGSQHTVGRYSTADHPGAKQRPIRFDPGEVTGMFDPSENARMQGINKLVTGLGVTSELGRQHVPWFNPTQQGIKELAKAYVDNPALFTGRVWLHAIMPQIIASTWNQWLGKDPNGDSYYDHMLYGRGSYPQIMGTYYGFPGRPVAHGVELPRVQEMTLPMGVTAAVWDHLTRSSILDSTRKPAGSDENRDVFSQDDDLGNALKNWLDVFLWPPTPVMGNVAFAATGNVGPQNMMGFLGALTQPMGLTGFGGSMTGLGGDVYKRNFDPFDQNAGMPGSLDMLARAIAPSIADLAGVGYNTFIHTQDSFGKAISNAAWAVGRKQIEKTPLVRDIFDVHGPISGNTPVQAELYQKNDSIRQLLNFYGKYGNTGIQSIGPKKIASPSAEAMARAKLGARVPSESSGLDEPLPDNPLYLRFMDMVHNKFQLDAAKHGGIGYKTMWNFYKGVSDDLKSMRNIDYGSQVDWMKKMEQRPKQIAYLQNAGIDYTDPHAVRDFYERKRQNWAREILWTIKDVENEMSQQLEQLIASGAMPATIKLPIKIEDLRPYTGQKTPSAPDVNPEFGSSPAGQPAGYQQ